MTLWYPRYMLQYRIAIFEGGATLAGIIIYHLLDDPGFANKC